jgi:PAS domain S-box-containing protein
MMKAKGRVERKRAQALLAGQKQLLEMIARGTPLDIVLDALCRLVDELSEASLSSILLLEPDSQRLRHGAAPNLPKSYADAIDGALIGPAAGSCGTAAYRKEPVIVSDIAHDPLWAEYRDLALPHGLRACWSTPVFASDARVLGTFAIYFREVRRPTPQEHNIIEQVTNLASVAIERTRAEAERQAHLAFLESMDQVNRAIQGTNDIERMMSDVLELVLSIFNCDRSWLVYPSDPDAVSQQAKTTVAAEWTWGMLRTRPGVSAVRAWAAWTMPVDPEMTAAVQAVRAANGPVQFGAGTTHPMSAEMLERWGIQSRIVMALYPKGAQPYTFGLTQCAYPRIWTAGEERLFQEIGRRLEDALTSLLMFRTLGESERKLEEAQRISHVGHWERDLALDQYTLSDETCRIYGLEPQQRIVGVLDIEKLVHPADRDLRAAAWAVALETGRYDVEYRMIRPNGDVRVVHGQGDLARDESGRPRRMFGSVQDITERKRAEQRLVVQHAVTQILAESATLPEATPRILQAVCEGLTWDLGALWSVDRDAGLLRCIETWHTPSVSAPRFEAASRTTTVVRGQGLPGRVWSSGAPAYIPDIVNDANFSRAHLAAHEGLHAAFGFPIVLGEDVLGVMEFFSREIRQPDQDLLGMMATIGSQIGQFIERKWAEEALQTSEASLAEAQQISHTGSWRWNPGTGEVRPSAELARIFGFDPATAPRSPGRYRERVHPDDRPTVERLVDEAVRDTRAFQHEYRISLPDGTVKHVQAVGRPDTDASGNVEFVGTIIDITERKHAEEALRDTQAELARVARLTTMGELTASIAHEINQPLGAVVNNASACVRWLAAQNLEEARRSLAMVIADGHRAADIIGRIRALAQKAPPRKDWLDLNDTIRDAIALTRNELQAQRVFVMSELAGDLPLVLGDRIQLQQVLLNLMINAIEAMSSDGDAQYKLVVRSARDAAHGVLVAVEDSGPGPDPKGLDRLFEAFYTTKTHGLGLGLAISRRIIEAHGGRLWATANIPRGAVFQFTLPVGEARGS